MDTVSELAAIAGGLILSVACGLMLEELIFGGLVRLFFASQRGAGSDNKKRANQDGGTSC
jgi:hypothetical protein